MAVRAQSKARNQGPTKDVNRKLLDVDEIARLRAWGLQSIARGQRKGALVTALLASGGRRFEVAALACENVRLGPGGPEVYFPAVKGGGSATVPISRESWAALEKWCQGKPLESPLIPTAMGDFMHVATLWGEFRGALLEAGIKRQVGVHATRHAAGFLLLRATGDLTKVQTFLRHTSLTTTANWYKHVHLPDLRAGLEKAGM
jgi:site-specific recombinase XerD